MSREKDAYQWVLSQVAEVVDEMYERYRERCNLEKEKDTERQLEILASKKYISSTYISDLSLIADYYARGMNEMYNTNLLNYQYRVRVQTEKMPH